MYIYIFIYRYTHIYIITYIQIYSYNFASKTRITKYLGLGSASDHRKGNAAHQRTRRGDGGRWDVRSLMISIHIFINVPDRTDESVYGVWVAPRRSRILFSHWKVLSMRCQRVSIASAKEADGVSTPGMKERFLTNIARKSAGHQTRVTARY